MVCGGYDGAVPVEVQLLQAIPQGPQVPDAQSPIVRYRDPVSPETRAAFSQCTAPGSGSSGRAGSRPVGTWTTRMSPDRGERGPSPVRREGRQATRAERWPSYPRAHPYRSVSSPDPDSHRPQGLNRHLVFRAGHVGPAHRWSSRRRRCPPLHRRRRPSTARPGWPGRMRRSGGGRRDADARGRRVEGPNLPAFNTSPFLPMACARTRPSRPTTNSLKPGGSERDSGGPIRIDPGSDGADTMGHLCTSMSEQVYSRP